MKLSKVNQLLQSAQQLLLKATLSSPDREITQLTSHSKNAEIGTLFFAVKGVTSDGHSFLSQVISQGCLSVVVEESCGFVFPAEVTVFYVSDTKKAFNLVAQQYFGNPVESLHLIGVTGTNGKTTVTHMIEHILNSQGLATGVMGTIDHHIGNRVWQSHMTTPDTVDFYKRLGEFVEIGAKVAALEISSHALKQQRVDDVSFTVAVFTNLTRDHLDYHSTMEDYFLSKCRLFDPLLRFSNKNNRYAWVNGDDPWSKKIPRGDGYKLQTFGENDCDLQFKIHSSTFKGLDLTYSYKSESLRIKLPFIGSHNASNAAAAIGSATSLGVDFKRAVESLANFRGVRGRLEKVPQTRDIDVFVDYAHTDQALETVLVALQKIRQSAQIKNKITVVFGCGGDRDKGKRPLMAQAAEKFADHVVVTSDNPRSEPPLKILEDIRKGFSHADQIHFEVDRREAIRWALNKSKSGDVVLVAGKGHENYQIIGDQTFHFDDVEEVREFFNGLDT